MSIFSLKKIFSSILFLLILLQFQSPEYLFSEEANADYGEELFSKHCNHCHSIGANKVGPDLKGVYNEQSEEWLKEFIRSPQALIDKGDPHAKKLAKEFKGRIMPNHKEMTDPQIDSIVLFLKKASESDKVLAKPDGRKIFINRCSICHTIGSEKIGADLKNVHERRSEKWLFEFIRAPQEMAKVDSEAKKLIAQYDQIMPGHSDLSDIEIRAVIDFIKVASETDEMATTAAVRSPIIKTEIEEPGLFKDLDFKPRPIHGFIAVLLLLVVLLLMFKKIIPISIGIFSISILLIIIFIGIVFEIRGFGIHKGYAPKQPINYSHKIHAGDLKLDCLYCHFGAEKSKHAGIPPVNVCMNCHSSITMEGKLENEKLSKANREKIAKGILEIKKIQESYNSKKPIEWKRIHRLPDHVYFNHSQHVKVGKLSCQACHGPIEKMDVVKQYSDLTMGWCLDCHKKSKIPGSEKTVSDRGGKDCAVCHY